MPVSDPDPVPVPDPDSETRRQRQTAVPVAVAVAVAVSVTASVTASVSEGRVRGSEQAARPRHGHLRVVHTDRFEESIEPQRHGATERAQSPPTRPRRNHEGTKTPRDSPSPPPTPKRRAAHPPENAKAQRRKDAKGRVPGTGAPPPRGGRTAGDRIACRRQAAGGLRTRAFVAAALLTGSRARGTAVLPLALASVSGRDGPTSIPLIEDEELARPALSESAGQGGGTPGRTLGFDTESRHGGFRPSDGRRPRHLAEPSWLGPASLRGGRGGRALRLCVFGWAGGLRDFFVTWCLRGSGRVGGSVPPLCPLWLCGSDGWVEIRNPTSEIRNGRVGGIPNSEFRIRPLPISRTRG